MYQTTSSRQSGYREFLYIIEGLERETSGCSQLSVFLLLFIIIIFLILILVQEGFENDPEPRGDVLTKFRPKRSHLDPIRAYFYDFWGPDVRTFLPMSAWGHEKNDDELI